MGPSGLIYTTDGDALRALDPATGEVVARYLDPARDGHLTAPTVDVDERLYAANSSGALCLVREQDELVPLWTFEVSEIGSRPSIDKDGTLYYTLETTEIIALEP